MASLVWLASLAWLAEAAKEGAMELAACHAEDHSDCDDACKEDSFWYGQCGAWDGATLRCDCFAYLWPLSGSVCQEKHQEACRSLCSSSGLSRGGFCYPHPSTADPAGEARCRCRGGPAPDHSLTDLLREGAKGKPRKPLWRARHWR